MRKINASEINTYLFCERSWWFQNQGIDSNNLNDLASGISIHNQHSRSVIRSGLIKIMAYGFILSALILFSVYLVTQIL
jgi:CRISPR/Cas system-associated exonuclease Cas4 (RecB family)